MSGVMPSARATHAPHRANLRCLGLSAGIAIALAGCSDPNAGVVCTFLPTGDGWTATETIRSWGQWTIKMERKGGEVMLMTSATADKWRCGGAIATEAQRAETPQDGSVHEGAGPQDIAQNEGSK